MFGHSAADGAGGDVGARADHHVIGQVNADRSRTTLGGKEGGRVCAQGASQQRPERGVERDVANEHTAEQGAGIVGDHEFLVGLGNRVGEGDLERTGGQREHVTEARRIDPYALEFGALRRGRVDRLGIAEQLLDHHLGHQVAGGHQTGAFVLVARAFADRPDVRVGGPAGRTDHDAATLADRQTGFTSNPVARPNAGGEDDHIDVEHGAVGEHQPTHVAVGRRENARGRRRGVHGDAHLGDEDPQSLASAVVELNAHEAVGELDHAGARAKGLQRGGGFEAENSPAHDGAAHLPAQLL